MIVVDSSVLIDFFRENSTEQALQLGQLVRREEGVAITPIIRYEILAGAKNAADLKRMQFFLGGLEMLGDGDYDTAFFDRAAERYRTLRRRGITIRKSTDVWIASTCIEQGVPLLAHARDFGPFAEAFGLVLS